MPTDADAFDTRLGAWDTYLATPWARARYDVVADVLDQELGHARPGPLRILDLGSGDGLDSVRLAAAGHQVTIVDSSSRMLERARTSAQRYGCADRLRTVESDILGWHEEGTYDLALCHFVMMYLDPGEEGRVWPLLRRLVRPDGSASVICPNPVSDVLTAVHRNGDVRMALRRFHGEPVRAPTFDHEYRPLPRADVERAAAAVGFEVARRVGLRVAVDWMPEGPTKHDPDGYADILELELALADHHSYLDVARAWQLMFR